MVNTLLPFVAWRRICDVTLDYVVPKIRLVAS